MSSDQKHKNADVDQTGYDRQEASPKTIFLYGLLGTFVLIVVLIFLMDYFTASKEKLIYEAVLSAESPELRELRARETDELTSYEVLDEEEGVFQIPIERAMELVADEAYRERMNK